MGGERTRQGKRTYLYFAGLVISIFILGCSTVNTWMERRNASNHLSKAEQFMAQGDYDSSLKENQEVLEIVKGRSPGDRALFNIGLILVHYRNPERDYKEAFEYFNALVRDYPKSPLNEQARTWVAVLDKIISFSRTIQQLEKDILAMEEVRLREIKLKEKIIEDLRNRLEKSKGVDIQIEEKKKRLELDGWGK